MAEGGGIAHPTRWWHRLDDSAWPHTIEELRAVQDGLAAATPPPWSPPEEPFTIGGVWFCAPTGSVGDEPGQPAWAAAAAAGMTVVVRGTTGSAYVPGALALREGAVLEGAVGALPTAPDVLLVNATGRDHPRRAGLALHLGAVLDVPTIGVTDRPLCATGPEPGRERWATAPLTLEGDTVGAAVRTRAGAHAVAVHLAWRTDLVGAIAVLRVCGGRARTPEPLRLARRAARLARARDEGRLAPPSPGSR